MKPFNLKLALAGDQVCTRDGRKVLQIAYFPDANEPFKLEVLIKDNGGSRSYWENGKRCSSSQSPEDLFMVTKTKKAWVAVHKPSAYATKEELIKYMKACDIEVFENYHIAEIEIEE